MLNLGKFSNKGCNDRQCSKWHPKICFTGVNTGNCSRAKCQFYHGHLITRKQDPRRPPASEQRPQPASEQRYDWKSSYQSENLSQKVPEDTNGTFLDSLRQEMNLLRVQMSQLVHGRISHAHPGMQRVATPQQMAVNNRLVQMANPGFPSLTPQQNQAVGNQQVLCQ